MELWREALLVVIGVAAGFLNVMAGGGSLLVMPVMVLSGMSGPLANGTTRVAILAQNVSATAGFRRRGFSDFRLSASLAACALPGAAAGAWFGTQLSGVWFNRVLAGVMIGVLLLMAMGRKTARTAADERTGPGGDSDVGVEPTGRSGTPRSIGRRRLIAGHVLMIVAGLYGGFIQAGVGFILMAILHRVLGLDLVRVNMHKVVIVGAYTVVAIAIFAARGHVAWITGAALAIGMATGGWIGSHVAVGRGERAIRIVLNVALIALAIKLILPSG